MIISNLRFKLFVYWEYEKRGNDIGFSDDIAHFIGSPNSLT